MGLRGTNAAAQHAPEEVGGKDLEDFGNAFGNLFSEDEEEKPLSNRFSGDPDVDLVDEEDEDLDEEEKEGQRIAAGKKPAEVDPLAGLEEKQQAAKEKWKFQKENKELKDRLAKLEAQISGNPGEGKSLKEAFKGKSHDEIVDMALAAMEDDGDTASEAKKKVETMTTDEIIKKAKEEMRREMEEERTKTAQETQVQQSVNAFKGKIKEAASTHAESYPLVESLGGIDSVYAEIEKDYLEKAEEFGEEYATKNMMSIEKGLKKVNDALALEVRNALKSKHTRNFILKALKDEPVSNGEGKKQSQDFSQLEDFDNSTLTNSVHRKVTDPKDIRELSEEEQLAQAFGYLND